MMFQVRVIDVSDLTEIEGSWVVEDFRALLDAMDFADVASVDDGDLREMCLMSLQDLEPAGAAQLLLAHKLGDALSKGQVQNLSHEMPEEKLWEEYSDMRLHERLFHAASLLHAAFGSRVPLPDAVEVQLEVVADDPAAERVLGLPLHDSLLLRLLADGMPVSAPLHRMFAAAIGGKAFPEAESIAWIVRVSREDVGKAVVRIIGSGSWLDALRGTASFQSSARADAV